MKIKNLIIMSFIIIIGAYVFSNFVEQDQMEKKKNNKNVQTQKQTTSKINKASNIKITAEDYFKLGKRQRETNNYKNAISNYTKAIELKPYYWQAYEARAEAKDKIKDIKGAKEDYSKAIEIKKKIIETKINMPYDELEISIKDINTKIKQKDYLNALNLCNEIINENPYYVDLYIIQADIFLKMKDYDNLINCYSKIINLTPDNCEILYDRAQLYYNLKQFDKAESDYKEIYKINKNYKETLYYLLNSLMNEEKFEDFYTTLKEYIKIKNTSQAYVYANDFYNWENTLNKYSYNNPSIKEILNKIKELKVISK